MYVWLKKKPTSKYCDSTCRHTTAGLSDNTKASIRQRGRMRKSTHRHTLICIHHGQLHVHSFGLLWLCRHLWLFLCISRLGGMAADSHTQTHANVINSITHTPVNTNEAKTNPFLFVFCLRFLTKRLFFSLFFFIIKQIR